MFLCIVVVTKRQMKVARENRLRRHRDREFTENMTATLRKNLSESMATIERGFRFDSQESMERYGKACDYLVYCCSEYMFGNHREFSHIIKPYRDQCYSNAYPFVDWRNGSYQHIPGTDLAEEIAKAEKIVVQKQQEEFERRQHSNMY